MKFLIRITLLLLASTLTQAKPNVTHVYPALETNGIKVEFIETTERGEIRPIDCSHCLLKIYNFYADVEINKAGKPVTLNQLLKEYQYAPHPTLFIDLDTNVIYKINY